MQIWFIGRTLASQAGETGSIPAICFFCCLQYLSGLRENNSFGYRPFPDAAPKQRTIQSFGYLEDQQGLDAFWKQVNECNDFLKKKRDLRIEIPVSEMMYSENNRFLNYGYQFPESVYRLLGVDSFISQYQERSGFRGHYARTAP